jgi:hypothetical protein
MIDRDVGVRVTTEHELGDLDRGATTHDRAIRYTRRHAP